MFGSEVAIQKERDATMSHDQVILPELNRITHPRWNREDLLANDQWKKSISAVVWEEFLERSKQLRLKEINWQNYQPSRQEAPQMTALAEEVRTELEKGTGVVWLQNPYLARVSHDQACLFFLLFCTQFAETVDTYGKLYNVLDQGTSYKESAIPVSQTRESTTFHTDSSVLQTVPDAIGLLCLRQAKSGGASLIVHAVDVHERMRCERPDLLRRLYQDYIRDVVTPGGEKHLEALSANRFPVFSYRRFSHGLSFRYMRYWIEKGHARAGLPLDAQSLEALDYLDSLLNDPAQVVDFSLQPGDILLVNNHLVAHNRTAYEDFEDPDQRRWLVRIWLKFRSVMPLS
jgi:alpha-ketoglutarate-dependent taurine dioxygenase